MQVIAHGLDLVHCPRLARLWQQHGARFLDRVFTEPEQAYCLDCKDPVIRLSGRFAAKEAVMKALGTGWRGGVEWVDIETLPDPLGKPLVTLRGRSQRLAQALGIGQILISITHAGEYALASALALPSDAPPNEPPAAGA